mmetsp:Transcript_8116/g.11864  ORF Transcript_8116/g.11864 Transcript_8116/m.11864 type:complete len:240 (-) Transcript_8116:1750-2469(-)
MDQGTRISQLRSLQVFLDFFGLVNVGVTADAFGFLELTKHTRSLDVLEVDVRILGNVDNRSKVVVETFGGTVLFKHRNEILRSKFLMVLLCNLNANLHVLRSLSHHVLEKRNTLLAVQLAEITHNKFWAHLMAVLEDTLDVIDLRVVLSSSLPHTSAFTQLSDVRTVVVGQNTLLHDGICHLWSTADQVDFQQFRLQISMFWLVVLQCLEQEGSGLLNSVGAQERLSSGLDVNQRAAFG